MKVELLVLQMNYPDVLLVNLPKRKVQETVVTFSNYEHVNTILNAYDMNFSEEWISPLYQQVINGQKIKFFLDYINDHPPNPSIWIELCSKVFFLLLLHRSTMEKELIMSALMMLMMMETVEKRSAGG